MAFAVDGDPDTQNRFVANLKIITSAASLGADESLIVHVAVVAAAAPIVTRRTSRYSDICGFRSGLEDAEDPIADITNAPDETFGAN